MPTWKSFAALALAPALLAPLVQTRPAGAAAGTLKSPSVALPATYPEEHLRQLMAVLNRPDCRFLGGFWLNSHTALHYRGEVEALNLFVDGLAKTPGLEVSVRFWRPEPDGSGAGPVESDWSLTQDGTGFAVRINLASPRMKLEQLRLPELRNPELPKTR